MTKNQTMLSFLLFQRKEVIVVPRSNDQVNHFLKLFPPRSSSWIFPQDHAVAVYSAFSILNEMRKELGLEAMLEYMGRYRRIVESYNPKMKSAVGQALTLMSVKKIYHEAASYEHS